MMKDERDMVSKAELAGTHQAPHTGSDRRERLLPSSFVLRFDEALPAKF